jgi:hypothetical protein
MRIKNKKATTLAEAIVVMLIIVTGVTWMYNIYTKSINISNSVNNKIQAIQIARQWIEAMINIRDTNWQIFSSDYNNCWNSLNYNSWCIWTTDNKMWAWSYINYKDSFNRWNLWAKTTWTFWTDYINNFRVLLDDKWIYTQSWTTTELKPIFTREIKISYPETHKMKVTSLVQWVDSSSSKPHKVEIDQILTNWKK